jgi:flagellar hook-associated protein 1 FlgK
VLSGGTATAGEAWSQIVYRVGADISSAKMTAGNHDQILLQLSRLRDQTSGVSLDEEAANLMRYQRAYQANARYFTTIMDTLDTLMGMVR